MSKNDVTGENPYPMTINGILNMKWLQEEAKKMTPEKEKAILRRNEAMTMVPVDERREWVEKHPLEEFY